MVVERVLVADADAATRASLTEALGRHGCQVATASDGPEALRFLEQHDVDLLLADAHLAGPPGRDLLQVVHEIGRDVPVVLMVSGDARSEGADALQRGAFGCLVRPVRLEALEALLRRASAWYEQLRADAPRPAAARRVVPAAAGEALVGRHPRIVSVIEMVRRAARSKATLLVQGESGTGKELIALLAHQASPRRGGPLVKVNCAALPATLLESELFGHERGAFSGAIARREGRFELAHGGTLLLDEISELPLPLQAKLLRAIEEEEFERVGGTETLHVDVRLVCTTNRDLARDVEEGRFRGDLYYRLNVVPVVVPPLRERRDDIPLLVRHFLKRFGPETDSPVRSLSKEAMDVLMRHAWPGNVRELRNLIHRVTVLSGAEVVRPEDLPADFTAERPRRMGSGLVAGRSVDEVERDLILKTLACTGGNKSEAARLLKVTTRTLRNKLGRYGEQDGMEGRAGEDVGTA